VRFKLTTKLGRDSEMIVARIRTVGMPYAAHEQFHEMAPKHGNGAANSVSYH